MDPHEEEALQVKSMPSNKKEVEISQENMCCNHDSEGDEVPVLVLLAAADLGERVGGAGL